MIKREGVKARRALTPVFLILGLMTVAAIAPNWFRSGAFNGNKSSDQSSFNQVNLDYYDIRRDKAALDTLAGFRQAQGVDAVRVADLKSGFVEGEEALKGKIPTLKIEYNKELLNPEVIAPDVLQGRALMTSASNAKRSEILRQFARENDALIGLSAAQLDNLKVTADYRNPNGGLAFARLEQFVGEIPVFRAEIRAGFTKQNEMFRVVNNLAPGLDEANLSKEFGNPAEAVRRAAGYIDYRLKENDAKLNEAASTDLKAVFGEGDWATVAEKMYFPTEPGVARAAWRVLNWQKGDAFYVIVDAETGAMLYRENITSSQTQAATYNVYANTTSMLKAMDNPAPLTPGPISPLLGTQGALQPRSNVTLIGNEAPYTFNNLGWIADNANGANGHTDGNNAEAGVDRDTTNGVDALVAGTNRVFNFSYTPGHPGGGDDPTGPEYQKGIVTNLFYVTNRFHDETYLLGFTEQARNFQHDNFGRGGNGNDRISAEGQDNTVNINFCPVAPCFNNANFSTPADGGRGRMQMYLWNQPTPDRDGDLDAEIIVHELTHGLFTRLHNGVGGTQAGQMNEGNSDFFAHVMLSELSDPIDGIYVTGGYSTYLRRSATFTSNYYYGIRRFPKAVKTFTGGPDNRPHNPLTYADIDPAQFNVSDGAFPPAFTGSATAVHDGGEIWSSMLWEVRARLVQRLGAEAGNKKVLQLVMDGMKISPSNPTMLQERNAILQAALNNGNTSDIGDIWAGFASRGLGANAVNNTGNTVVESFDLPNASVAENGFSVSDAAPGGDADGYPEPGETVRLNVPVTNNTGNPVNNVTATVTGGGSANYGNIANNATVSREISYQIPANAACGSLHTVSITVTSDLGAQTPITRSFRIGKPVFSGTTQNFDGVTAPALPSGWSQQNSGGNSGAVTTTVTPSSAPNAAFVPSPDVAGQVDLLTSANISSASAQLSFKNMFNSESTWDGMVLEIQIGGGQFQDIVTAGGSFVSGGYNSAIDSRAGHVIAGRPAWTGSSSGAYLDTVVNLPAAANGQIVNLRWREASDDNTTASGAPGHWIDNVALTGGTLLAGYECSVTPQSSARADFDGDGKTDLSVYRASEGNWYLNRSTDGFAVFGWGLAADVLTPGDFDGDGKTDVAVFRPSNGIWYILQSSTSTPFYFQFGSAGDIPVAGDYDGDGKTDQAVYRPSTNLWYVQLSTGGNQILSFGAAGDVPVRGDYDGDGKTDIAIYRGGQWWINQSSGGVAIKQFGLAADKPVPADYDGDGKDDLALYRASEGNWYITRSSDDAVSVIQFGNATDVPVPGDYDGDGRDDQAIYRDGSWWVNRSGSGLMVVSFGLTTDAPLPAKYVP